MERKYQLSLYTENQIAEQASFLDISEKLSTMLTGCHCRRKRENCLIEAAGYAAALAQMAASDNCNIAYDQCIETPCEQTL